MKVWHAATAAFLIVASMGMATADPADDLDVTAAANFFGNCAGVWDLAAEAMDADGKHATAEQFRNTGNGAQTAALWALAISENLKTGRATRYGSWLPLVQPKRENGRLRMHALLEQGMHDEISAEADACLAALSDQEGILQQMRADRVRQGQGE